MLPLVYKMCPTPPRSFSVDVWRAYWLTVGAPQDEQSAVAWWQNPGPIPEGFSVAEFRGSAPAAALAVVRERGLPRLWLEATEPSGRYSSSD